jgi:hypothetical protein
MPSEVESDGELVRTLRARALKTGAAEGLLDAFGSCASTEQVCGYTMLVADDDS